MSTQNADNKPGVFRQDQIKFKTVKFRTWIYKFDHAASNMQRWNSTAQCNIKTQKFYRRHPAIPRRGDNGGKDKEIHRRSSFQPYYRGWRPYNAIHLEEQKGSK